MINVLVGITAGLLRGVLGFLKSKEPFNLFKFLRTILISSISGGIVGLYIQDPLFVFSYAFTQTVVVEEIIISYLKRYGNYGKKEIDTET